MPKRIIDYIDIVTNLDLRELIHQSHNPLIFTRGQRKVVLHPQCKYTDKHLRRMLRKVGFRPLKTGKFGRRHTFENTLIAYGVYVEQLGLLDILIEFDPDENRLLRVVIADSDHPKIFGRLEQIKQRRQWQSRLGHMLNTGLQHVVDTGDDPWEGSIYDFGTVLIKTLPSSVKSSKDYMQPTVAVDYLDTHGRIQTVPEELYDLEEMFIHAIEIYFPRAV